MTAWFHADFCHAYAWVYEEGDEIRIRWGERDGENLSLHRRDGCERCTALARGYEKARYGETNIPRPPTDFASLDTLLAVTTEIERFVPGLIEKEAEAPK